MNRDVLDDLGSFENGSLGAEELRARHGEDALGLGELHATLASAARAPVDPPPWSAIAGGLDVPASEPRRFSWAPVGWVLGSLSSSSPRSSMPTLVPSVPQMPAWACGIAGFAAPC